MKQNLLFTLAIGVVFLIVFNSYSGGPGTSGAGDRTGRPGGSGTCSSCHSGGSFGGSISLQVLDANNNVVTQYTGGQTYTLQVNLGGSAPKHGFQLVAVKASSTTSNAGSLTPLSAGTQVVNLGGRDYVEQSSPQNSNTFSATWQAPAAGFGNVRFYFSGLLANGNFGTSGDQVVNSNLLLNEFSLPPLVISGSVTNVVCANDATGSIQVSTSGGQPPYIYLWNNGNTGSTITGLTPGTYTVTATDANGSTQNNSFTIISTSTANLTLSTTNSVLCDGDSTTITANSAASYSWNTGATTASITVQPSTTTSYSVTATFADGCSLSAQSQIQVNPIPTVTITALDSVICEGGSMALVASGATSYSWSTNETGAQIAVVPANTTTYSVTGTSLNCSSTESFQITVNQNPTVSIMSANGLFEYCEGDGINLYAVGAQNYIWENAQTTDSIYLDLPFDTNFEVIGIDSNGCADTTSAVITVHELPQVTFDLTAAIDTVCVDSNSIQIQGGLPLGGVYAGDFVTNGSFSPSASGLGTHEIVYSYTDSMGCSNAASATIEVINCVNNINDILKSSIAVYPNPFTNNLTIQSDFEKYTFKILSVDGRVVFSGNSANNVKTIDVAFLNPGNYVLLVETKLDVTNYSITKY